MNQWSRTRKRIILGIVLFVVFVLIGVPLYLLMYRAPTCFDGERNGDETGVDCGGSCQLLCTAESLPLLSKGDPRVLTVADGVYEVVALVENPNADAEISRARYTLKLYDATSAIPVKIIEGETFVPKAATFAIFEGPFNLETGVVPARATLEWELNSLVWQKSDVQAPELLIKDRIVSRTDSSPRVSAVVENFSLKSVSNIDLIALVYDEEGNIFAASKTFIETLGGGAEALVVFTWPRPFTKNAAQVDIIARVFPDRSFLK